MCLTFLLCYNDNRKVKMMWILICLGCCFLYRFLSNRADLQSIQNYKEKYEAFLETPDASFAIHEAAVKRLFQRAKIKDVSLSYCEPVGYGKLRTGSVSLFNNMGSTRDDAVFAMRQCFLKAEGVFQENLSECFSPLYWIRTIIFLPNRICEYFGGTEDQVLAKVLQLVYWVLVPIALVWRDSLYLFIRQLMNQLP